MMKQWQFTQSGHPRDVLSLAEVPIPTTCADDEVLVRISHASLFPAYAHRIMTKTWMFLPKKKFRGEPIVPEAEYSGVVCELKGSKVTDLKTGDRVFGLNYSFDGVLREYAVIKIDYVAKVPANVSLRDASSFPGGVATAYHAMTVKLKVKKADRVFIAGGAGALGVFVVQFARWLVGPTGYVVTSCSKDKMEAVKKLGADEVIDYRAHDLPQYLSDHYATTPFDYIFDIPGSSHALYSRSPEYLKPLGTFVGLGLIDLGNNAGQVTKRLLQVLSAFFLPKVLGGVPRNYIFSRTVLTRPLLQTTANLMEEGAVKAVIDSVYKFDDVLLAYDRILDGKYIGKVIVEVAGLD